MIPSYKCAKRNNSGNETGNSDVFSLFNLTTDLGEVKNIAKEEPQKMEQIINKFLDITKGYYTPNATEEPLK